MKDKIKITIFVLMPGIYYLYKLITGQSAGLFLPISITIGFMVYGVIVWRDYN